MTMSATRQQLDITVDVEKPEVFLTGAIRLEPLTLFRGNQILFRATLTRTDGTAYAVPVGSSYVFGIDDSYVSGHPEYVLSQSPDFNNAGDWDDCDPSAGRICWRANTNTTELRDALDGVTQKTMYAGLWIIPPSGKPYLLAHWEVMMANVTVEVASTSPAPSYDYMLASEALSLFALASPANSNYRVRNDLLQIKNTDTNNFHTIYIEGAAGAETLAIGAAEQ